MVSVSQKEKTVRSASAYGEVHVSKVILNFIKNNELKKGDVLTTAKIAGIQGAKRTSELIPLCHNIFISRIDIEIRINENKSIIEIISSTETNSETGIEMEALSAVSIAALTIYDMCKSSDKNITISNIHLLSKKGGKSGSYKRNVVIKK